jgi:hypothetical protein
MRNCVLVLLLLLAQSLQAQDTRQVRAKHFNIGGGLGMDYGGFGLRGTYHPLERLGLFTSAGYNFNTVGFNTGVQWLFPKNRHAFYLTAMYGYNGVIVVDGLYSDRGTYYGITAGIGYQLKLGSHGNFLNFELLVPFRNSNYYDDYDAVRSMGVTLIGNSPVGFSAGYHLWIRRKDKG